MAQQISTKTSRLDDLSLVPECPKPSTLVAWHLHSCTRIHTHLNKQKLKINTFQKQGGKEVAEGPAGAARVLFFDLCHNTWVCLL